jgi:ABC-type transporter Mla maintaining outer membrane lipid asymmetry ATPase subunit MlaF
MPAVISVTDLHRSYGAVEAVRGVSFTVEAGQVFGLLGPNGAGKTTILETLEGLRPVRRGEVVVNEVNVARDPYRVRRMIGVQLQQAAFFDQLTLAIGLAVSGWVCDHQRAPVVASSIAFPLIFIGLFPVSVVSGLSGQLLALLPVSMATHALRGIVSGSSLGSFGGDLLGLGAWAIVALAAAGRVFRWDD